jgi:TolA-binding protein
MKKVFILIALLVPIFASAAETTAASIQKVENKSTFKGLLYKVWSKFRSLSPKNTDKAKYKRVAVTAGIRGSETTSSILQPYWKDDKTNDKKFVQQLQDFAHAQKMVDGGDLPGASQAFSSFMESYPDSDLRANAQFAIGMTQGGMGQNSQCVQTFQSFVTDYPNHPLASDAKQVIAELK